MGAYKYIAKAFEESYKNNSDSFRKRMQKLRRGETIHRLDRPTNLARARTLGFKAKKGFILVAVRVPRGKRRRRQPDLGRKPGKNRKTENPGRSWQWFAERRALRRYHNMSLVNSYWLGGDGVNQYYEVILRDELDSTPQRQVKAKAQKAVEAVKPVAQAPKPVKKTPVKEVKKS